jgi:hypothetical protein
MSECGRESFDVSGTACRLQSNSCILCVVSLCCRSRGEATVPPVLLCNLPSLSSKLEVSQDVFLSRELCHTAMAIEFDRPVWNARVANCQIGRSGTFLPSDNAALSGVVSQRFLSCELFEFW